MLRVWWQGRGQLDPFPPSCLLKTGSTCCFLTVERDRSGIAPNSWQGKGSTSPSLSLMLLLHLQPCFKNNNHNPLREVTRPDCHMPFERESFFCLFPQPLWYHPEAQEQLGIMSACRLVSIRVLELTAWKLWKVFFSPFQLADKKGSEHSQYYTFWSTNLIGST